MAALHRHLRPLVWSRKFYAMASSPAPDRLMVDARTAEELETLMKEAETAAALRTPTSERRLP
ncbi:hypothetical protein ACQP1K_08000 [Sphaerimonospora sp. CA-214678]|uniref:hypothetical protein n=1 Tax=Sphaerimonospora sp. CA-214678 TaxID=3240029 RepID=UPI003D8E4BE8